MNGATGALRNVKVIELGQLGAEPFCWRLLGNMGAEVMKVEPPGRGRSNAQMGQLRAQTVVGSDRSQQALGDGEFARARRDGRSSPSLFLRLPGASAGLVARRGASW